MSDPIIKQKKSKRSREEPFTTDSVEDSEQAPPAVETVETSSSTKKSSKKDKKSRVQDEASTEPNDETTGETKETTEATEEEEVPALSHKEKRLAKRRKLAGLPEPDAPAAAPAATGQGGIAIGNTPAKSAHGIWVGNFNYATTSKDVLAFFADRGLKDVTRINMPNGKRAGEANRGFAYIDFPTATDVEIAVGLSEQHLDGRKLLIKSSNDYTGRPLTTLSATALPPSALVDPSSSSNPIVPSPNAIPGKVAIAVEGPQGQTLNRTARKILDRQRNPPGPTLFIGNLGFETVAEDIRTMFDAHQKQAANWAPREKGPTKEERAKAKAEKKIEKEKTNVVLRAKGEDSEEEDVEEEEEGGEDGEGEDKMEEDEKIEVAVEGDEEEGGEVTKAKRVRPKKTKSKDEPKAPLDLTKAETAGIRKIRLGTFEDTGKCKGWAFVDFHLPEQCTRALLNIRNHTLDGRTLNVEYASAEAVRRGGIGTKNAVPRPGGGGHGAPQERKNPARMEKKGRDWDDQDVRDEASKIDCDSLMLGGGAPKAQRSEFGFRPSSAGGAGRGGRGGGRGGAASGGREGREQKEGGPRAKPGAALASAQRASEAIVESKGRKITFD